MKAILLIYIFILSSSVAFAENNDIAARSDLADEAAAPTAAAEIITEIASLPDVSAEPAQDIFPLSEAEGKASAESTSSPDTVPEKDREIILALESEDVIVNDSLTKIYSRPFLYKETTYVPFRIIAEALGTQVEYDNETRSVYAAGGQYQYSVPIDSDKVFVFNDTLFVPLREMCTELGFEVFWNSGLIIVSKNGTAPSEKEVREYKRRLSYEGYRDKYYVPAHIVDPYKTYSYDQMREDVVYLSRAYPDIIKVFSIGVSTEGRDMIAFTLGTGKKRVVMCASMHAREYIATNYIMHMADSYAFAYVNRESFDKYNVKELLDKVAIVIIPMVNPDGISLAQFGLDASQNREYLSELKTNSYGYRGWKANTNGVDLNGNFDLMWQEKGKPSYEGWAGPYAASEAETQAMQKYISDNDFEIFASLHTQGQVVYWMDPNCDQSLVGICKPHVDRLCKEIGFLEMPSDGVVGKSGFMTDYVRHNKRKMAMTIELCPFVGNYPYPESDFDTVERPVKNLGLILADIALKIIY